MKNIESILLGGGNFWITEAVFKNVRGVLRITPGYAGGYLENPSYLEVCTGRTGHVEVGQLYFNPEQIDLESILNIFFEMHDPTSGIVHGVEKGSQYRSYVGCESLGQLKRIKQFINKLLESNIFPQAILTDVEMNTTFYEAVYYQHNYYQIHKKQPYATRIINPILGKVQAKFQEYYKTPLLAS